jgi:hypothetical protein
MNGNVEDLMETLTMNKFKNNDDLKGAFEDIYNILDNDMLTELINDVVSGKITRAAARVRLKDMCSSAESSELTDTCLAEGYALIESLSLHKATSTKMNRAPKSVVDDAVGIIENYTLVGVPLALMMLFIIGDKVASGQRLAEESKALRDAEEYEIQKRESREEEDRDREYEFKRGDRKIEHRLKHQAYMKAKALEDRAWSSWKWNQVSNTAAAGPAIAAGLVAVIGAFSTLGRPKPNQ